MQQFQPTPCEVCNALAVSETDGVGAASGTTTTSSSPATRRVLIEHRVLTVCDHHAARIELARVTNLDQLRRLFTEQEGRRSLISRRTPLDRRMFPPRPEGRRMGRGRRVSDVEI